MAAFAVSLRWDVDWHAAYLVRSDFSLRSYGIRSGCVVIVHVWTLPDVDGRTERLLALPARIRFGHILIDRTAVRTLDRDGDCLG